MTWTIVLVHRGKQEYLDYNLKLLNRLNPHSDIILVGDESNARLVEQSRRNRWFSIEDLAKDDTKYKSFIDNYKHFSINKFSHERFCFERWFILLNLAKTTQLHKFVYIDSDNFLLVPPNRLLETYTDYDYGQTFDPFAPEFIFFERLDALREFCNYIDNLYANDHETVLKVVLKNTAKIWGGTHPSGSSFHFSDMWAMLDFWENTQGNENQIYQFQTQKFKHVCLQECMPDASINIHSFNEYKSNIYRFDGKGSEVSVLHKGKWKRVNMIHFQGNSKRYIGDFYLQFLRAVNGRKQFQCKILPPSEKSIFKKVKALLARS
ncbi:MAG: hypothetical protein F6K19_40755 [Cyanothece sp. SIO1E1]|nr:hypothetical protein [Cyanothece sp. SIO1E1]